MINIMQKKKVAKHLSKLKLYTIDQEEREEETSFLDFAIPYNTSLEASLLRSKYVRPNQKTHA